jgi:hypothetical protein
MPTGAPATHDVFARHVLLSVRFPQRDLFRLDDRLGNRSASGAAGKEAAVMVNFSLHSLRRSIALAFFMSIYECSNLLFAENEFSFPE